MTATLDRVRPLPFDPTWQDCPSVPAGPGAYDDVPFEVYERIPALTRRVLAWIDADNGGSPLHARAAYDGHLDAADRGVWRFGRAEHTFILEGEEELHKRWDVAPSRCSARKNDGSLCKHSPSFTDGHDWYCGVHKRQVEFVRQPRDFITEADLGRIRKMHEAVQAHPFNGHLRRPGFRELTIVFDVPVEFSARETPGDDPQTYETTLRHRVRLDRIAEPYRGYPFTVIDLKRMQVGSGATNDRERAIDNCELHVQAAMYVEAVRRHFDLPLSERVDFVWLFVEEGFPHDVVPLPASEETLRAGRFVLERRRRLWALCEHLGRWPGRVETRQLEEVHVWGHDPPPPCEEPGGLPWWRIKSLGAHEPRQTPDGTEV